MTSPKIDWGKVGSPEPVFDRFASRRSVIYGTKGVVASSQPLATEVGLEILRRGGNAADAAVATSAALNVTEPSCCGIGGDAFCLFFDAKTKTVKALNGSGRSPRKLTLDYMKGRGIKGSTHEQDSTMLVPSSIPATDLNSVTVPGCAAAWVDTVAQLGSGKLSLGQILEPAILLAEEGVPVSEIHSFGWQRSEDLIKNASPNADEMLLEGRAPLPGEVIQLPNLGKTFRELAEHGKDGFYKGRIADAIVELIQSKGGLMELDDLATHETEFVEPIKYTYNGEVTVYECPPNGQGLTALIALGVLDNMEDLKIIKPLLEMEHNSAEYLHALIEALRLGFADSQWYITDPAFRDAHVEKLLSKDYLASRAKLVDPTRTNPQFVHGNPMHSSDTVYFTVTDQWGNACSYIQSNYAGE
jgi:gamma-glutamyltranspeptidase/glutathione hydrolase